MENYIGIDLVKAKPKYKITYDYGICGTETEYVDEIPEDLEEQIEEGYQFIRSDGSRGWLSKEIFDKSYLKVYGNENLSSDISVSQRMVDDFIKDYDISTINGKVTIVVATLKNGFSIVESSSCVDSRNYSEELGVKICKARIRNQVWGYLGFLLQTSFKGVK